MVNTKYLHCLGLEKMPVMALEVGKSPARLGSRKMYQTLLCWEVGVESRYRHGFPGNLALMFDTGRSKRLAERLGLVHVPPEADTAHPFLLYPGVWVLAATHVK